MKNKDCSLFSVLLSVGLLCCIISPVCAQTAASSSDGNISDNSLEVRSNAGLMPVLPQMFNPVTTADFFNERWVKNSPLTAEFQAQTTRILPNNTISATSYTTIIVYRDGQGRVRREQTIQFTNAVEQANAEIANQTTEIYDPVAGYNYTLYPATRTALRYKKPILALQSAGWQTVPQTVEILAADKYAPGQTKKYKLEPPVVEQLGAQSIQGAEAIGMRLRVKIPAGVVGNLTEAETVHEMWYSPILKMLLKSSTQNPQIGEHSFMLTKLIQSEPPAALFQIPAAYRIVEMGMPLPAGSSPNKP